MLLLWVGLLPALLAAGWSNVTNVPVVLWHGMGDSCCNPMSMGYIKKLIETKVTGVYVKSLKLGENLASDIEKGFFANVNDLVANACQQIAKDPELANGYNAVGFSQGAQFLRAVAQRCPNPPMKNFISVGGQHQGIFGLPYCPGDTYICNSIRKALELGAYSPVIQNTVVQAQYWHDPLDEIVYKKKNIFLADINNELSINQTYKKNFQKLKNVVLIKFTKDNMVVPKESSWFGYFAAGNIDVIQPMNETVLYKEDRIGLKSLHESGKVHFLSIVGDHLQIPEHTFVIEIVEKFLNCASLDPRSSTSREPSVSVRIVFKFLPLKTMNSDEEDATAANRNVMISGLKNNAVESWCYRQLSDTVYVTNQASNEYCMPSGGGTLPELHLDNDDFSFPLVPQQASITRDDCQQAEFSLTFDTPTAENSLHYGSQKIPCITDFALPVSEEVWRRTVLDAVSSPADLSQYECGTDEALNGVIQTTEPSDLHKQCAVQNSAIQNNRLVNATIPTAPGIYDTGEGTSKRRLHDLENSSNTSRPKRRIQTEEAKAQLLNKSQKARNKEAVKKKRRLDNEFLNYVNNLQQINAVYKEYNEELQLKIKELSQYLPRKEQR